MMPTLYRIFGITPMLFVMPVRQTCTKCAAKIGNNSLTLKLFRHFFCLWLLFVFFFVLLHRL